MLFCACSGPFRQVSAGRSARIAGVVGRPEHGPGVDLVELSSASRPVLMITFASEGVARKGAQSMGNNPVLRRAPKQVCPECQSQGRYRLSAAAQADRLARFQRMLLPATTPADACPRRASQSENTMPVIIKVRLQDVLLQHIKQ